MLLLSSVISPSLAWDASHVDSLERALQAAEHDTFRIDIMSKLGKVYHRSDPAKALKYSEEALELSKSINFVTGMEICYNDIGAVYYYQGKYGKALEYYLQSLKRREQKGNKYGIAIGLNNIAGVYNVIGDYDAGFGL